MVTGIIPKAGNRAGLIVIFQVDGVPGERLLPFGKAGKKALRPEFAQKPFDLEAVGFHMFKGKYGGKLPPGGIDQILRHPRGDKHRFPYRKGIVAGKHFGIQPVQHPVAAFGGNVVLAARQGRAPFAVGQRVFVNDVDDIAAEARHAALQPEPHDLLDGLYDLFVVKV